MQPRDHTPSAIEMERNSKRQSVSKPIKAKKKIQGWRVPSTLKDKGSMPTAVSRKHRVP